MSFKKLNPFKDFQSDQIQRSSRKIFTAHYAWTDGFKYSFFSRVVDEWNGLPNHIRESNSIATFKRNVLSFIKDN